MITNATQAFINTMIGPDATVYVRLELLDKNEYVIQQFDSKCKDGSIDVDRDRDVRRQFSLTLDNPSNMFTWQIGGVFWIDKRIKFYVGLMTPSGIEWVPQGVFLLETADADSKTGEAHFGGGDKWKLFDGNPLGKFTNTTTIKAISDSGKPMLISDAIAFLAQMGGEKISNLAFDQCATVLPYDLTYQPGEAIGKAMKELADLAVYSLFYDVNGMLRFRPRLLDPTTQPSVWTYDKSQWSLYAGGQKVLDTTKLYNKVLVIGGSQQTGTVSAIAANTDQNDPLSTVNIGERLFVYNNGSPDPLITDNTLAMNRAKWELDKGLEVGESRPFDALPNYLHDAEDVILFVDDETGTNDKFQLLRFNIPLKAGALMSGESRKARRTAA